MTTDASPSVSGGGGNKPSSSGGPAKGRPAGNGGPARPGNNAPSGSAPAGPPARPAANGGAPARPGQAPAQPPRNNQPGSKPAGNGAPARPAAASSGANAPAVKRTPGAPSGPGARPSSSGDATRPVPPGSKPAAKPSSSPAESAAARAVANGGSNARSNVPNRPGTSNNGQGSQGDSTKKAAAAAPAGLRPQAAPAGSPAPSAARPTGNSPRPSSAPRPMTQPRPSGGENWSEQGSPNGRPEQGGGGGSYQTATDERAGAEADAPRVARLTLASIDVWSALKISFLLSVASAIALVIAVSVLWLVLSAMGVFDSLNEMLNTLGLDQSGESSFDIYNYVGFTKVLSISIVLGAVNALIMTALSTVGVLLYNLSSGLVGGVRVTLSDD
ncbi:DUF3566 domain-containing protein [Kineosporia babensis]|uniref:DUF3566 domain-containing protein n=1 Tax=Kineosporia babensis TaxID=499548 RepID=A0A9X1NQ24_9ACTN|nr:DUF3566 domain-containing protein [Kineosporia babensis]MCD5317073.1 DUF3566 domain-containing protein [Kineosporia babensis]